MALFVKVGTTQELERVRNPIRCAMLAYEWVHKARFLIPLVAAAVSL